MKTSKEATHMRMLTKLKVGLGRALQRRGMWTPPYPGWPHVGGGSTPPPAAGAGPVPKKDEATVEMIKGLLKELLGPEQAEFQQAQEARGRELITNHMSRFFAEANKAKEAPPEKGRAFTRTLQCLSVSKGDKERALKLMKSRYPGDEGSYKYLEEGTETGGGVTVKALGSNDFDSGGALAPGAYSNDLIELLRPASVVRSLNSLVLPLDQGVLDVPKITGGAVASYAGENQARNATAGTTGNVTLSAKELGVIVPMSNKLLAVASIAVDNMVRTDAISAIGQREDLAFLQGDGTENTPRGMRYWAVALNIDATAYSNSPANVTSGVKSLLKKLMANNVRMLRPGWVFHPDAVVLLKTIQDSNGNYVFRDEMAAGTFWGYPYRSTTQVPALQVILADFADWVIGQMSSITIDASGTAAYNDSTGTVVAAYSRNQTVIRLIENHDCASRHGESIAILTAATWN